MPLVLRPVELQHVLPHQRRPAQLRQVVIQGPLGVGEADLPVRSPAAVNGVEKLLDLVLGPDAFFDLAAREVDLVAPVRHAGLHEGFEGRVCLAGGPVGRADGEDVRDELGVPECGSVDDGSSLIFSHLR